MNRPPTISRRRLALALPGLLLAAPVTRAEDGVAREQILIGQSITLRGGADEYGSAVLTGVQAYLQSVNSAGGVHGRSVVLKTLDDDARPAQAEQNARRLVTQDKVFLLFGSIEGGPSAAVMKAALDLGVPFFGPMAGSPALRRPHQRLVFPVRAEHMEEFRALLAYAHRTGARRVAFVRSDSDTGMQHLENMRRLCAELGLQPPLDLPFKADPTDAALREMVARMVSAGTEVVLNHGSAGMYERLIRKAHELNLRASFSGVNSGSTQLVRHLGELALGMVFSQVVPSPWERKSALTREYQQTYAREKPGQDYSYGSLEGFMTAKALVAALRLAGPRPTRDGLVQSLEQGPGLALDDRLRAVYKPGDHVGLSTVDLAIVTRDLKFRH